MAGQGCTDVLVNGMLTRALLNVERLVAGSVMVYNNVMI